MVRFLSFLLFNQLRTYSQATKFKYFLKLKPTSTEIACNMVPYCLLIFVLQQVSELGQRTIFYEQAHLHIWFLIFPFSLSCGHTGNGLGLSTALLPVHSVCSSQAHSGHSSYFLWCHRYSGWQHILLPYLLFKLQLFTNSSRPLISNISHASRFSLCISKRLP